MSINNKYPCGKISLLLTLCVLFWSGNFIIGRGIHEDVEPLQLAFFRWGGVAILVFPILVKNFSLIIKTIKNNFLILNLLSILGISAFNTILYVGLNYTKATNALLINSFVPIMILVMSFFILKISIKPIQLIGILLSTFGVIFLILQGELSSISSIKLNYGDIWVLTASFTWALYSIVVKFRPKELGDLEFFTTIVYMGLFWIILIYMFMGYSIVEDISLAQKHYSAFIYIALFPSVLSYYFWHKGIKEIGANRTGQFTHLMPLFGSLLAYIFLDEQLSSYHLIGAVFIGFGIYLSLFIARKKNDKMG